MAMSRISRFLTVRNVSTVSQSKPAGDFSAVFPSLRPDYKPEPLPDRFQELKQHLFRQNPEPLTQSWPRLLSSLQSEIEDIYSNGSKVVPSLNFNDLKSGNISPNILSEIRRRGTVVIRNVLPKSFALELKQRAKDYIAANRERITAFPPDSHAVYELYWTPSQVAARSHPNMLETQRFLQSLWHSSDPSTPFSSTYSLAYADRLRIRNPGDEKFTLGPHADGGSLERWEDPEYSKVYRRILEGSWEEYDAYDAKHRVTANVNIYNGAGACSMARFFQGWLSMSDTGPGEGTLRVCPMLKHSTAYTILRPFFDLETLQPVNDSTFPGAVPGASQEYSEQSHPHLNLPASMVSIPHVQPGDYVAWHCDTIHAVDKEHRGKGDSSVLYVSAPPLCEMNAEYLKKQREAALAYSPPWDFPDAGGLGERGFEGTVDWSALNGEGLQAMGMGSKPWAIEEDMGQGEIQAIEAGNRICFGES
ncbi:hypothetical protein PRK78_001439 [Emydomyces testavorans]|uniref:DUF1479 domain protein n=1 Tax=Emydomyces testavorans TaxID=2070801 RepID=A0AAF0DCJ0_9EURO|nr:hypothetical protein PRK78_001439 [Emydomyces testavorans]